MIGSDANKIKRYLDLAQQNLQQNNEKDAVSYASGALFAAFEFALFFVFNKKKQEPPVLEEAVLCNLLGINFVDYFRYERMIVNRPSFSYDLTLMIRATYNVDSLNPINAVNYCTHTTNLILDKLNELNHPFSSPNP